MFLLLSRSRKPLTTVDSEHYFGRDLKASSSRFFRISWATLLAGNDRQGGAGMEAEDAGGEDPGDLAASLLRGQRPGLFGSGPRHG
jgi:hypothetical protein